MHDVTVRALEPDVLACGTSPLRPRGWRVRADELVIGLVNNMAPAAMRAIERQFRQLLCDAAPDGTIRLRLFVLPGFSGPKHDEATGQPYEDGDALWASRLDGLIVTGTEPRAEAIADEPSWPALARLVDWAASRTLSTVWSCYAAHAAVFRLDEIARYALPEKLSGVFECAKASDHILMADAPSRWQVPHSRYNSLDEACLLDKGYSILSRGPQLGPDVFVKQNQSLFVFLQGHPEYDADALLREYRRDVRRFLAGERTCYPGIPSGYFDRDATAALVSFQERAFRERRLELMGDFQSVLTTGRIAPTWREPAVRFYRRWLDLLAQRKGDDLHGAEWHGGTQSELRDRSLASDPL